MAGEVSKAVGGGPLPFTLGEVEALEGCEQRPRGPDLYLNRHTPPGMWSTGGQGLGQKQGTC